MEVDEEVPPPPPTVVVEQVEQAVEEQPVEGGPPVGNSDLMTVIHSGGSRPAYTNPEALGTFPDLRLLSADGFYFEMNRAVFASISKLAAHFR